MSDDFDVVSRSDRITGRLEVRFEYSESLRVTVASDDNVDYHSTSGCDAKRHP
jgi:hypothetical protein